MAHSWPSLKSSLATVTLQQSSLVSGYYGPSRQGSDGWTLCVYGLLAFQRGQRFDGPAGLFFGETQIVEALEIEPELRAGAKGMGQAQGRISGDAASSVEDLRHAVGGHTELAGEFRSAHIQCVKFLSQVLARMNSGDRHDDPPSDSQRFQHATDLVHGRATGSKFATGR